MHVDSVRRWLSWLRRMHPPLPPLLQPRQPQTPRWFAGIIAASDAARARQHAWLPQQAGRGCRVTCCCTVTTAGISASTPQLQVRKHCIASFDVTVNAALQAT